MATASTEGGATSGRLWALVVAGVFAVALVAGVLDAVDVPTTDVVGEGVAGDPTLPGELEDSQPRATRATRMSERMVRGSVHGIESPS